MNTSTKRPVVTIFDDDSALTVLKPYSREYTEMLFVIKEDAYGEAIGMLMTIDNLRKRLNVDEPDFQSMLNSLE